MSRRTFIGKVAACATIASTFCVAPMAVAQSGYPSKPVRFIVPYAPGGLPDVVARHIGVRLSERLGQSVVVENKPGAGGIIAAQNLLQSEADGYTFMFSDTAWASITPIIVKNIPFDVKKDFMPVSYVAFAPNFLAVHPSMPVKTLDEFIAYAKKNPNKINCGSSGAGTVHHLAIEAMKKALELDIEHVPYSGSGQSVPALASGQVDCVLAAFPSLSNFAKADKARLLAVTGSQRSSFARDLPAMYEGREGFDFAFPLGVWARPGTSHEIVEKINKELSAIVAEPEIVKRLEGVGVEPVGKDAASLQATVDAQIVRMGNAASDAGLRPE